MEKISLFEIASIVGGITASILVIINIIKYFSDSNTLRTGIEVSNAVKEKAIALKIVQLNEKIDNIESKIMGKIRLLELADSKLEGAHSAMEVKTYAQFEKLDSKIDNLTLLLIDFFKETQGKININNNQNKDE